MPLDPDDPRPPYLQVAAAIRDAIRDGTYGPGDRLPSRTEMSAEYGVSPMTVQNALRELRDEGLVVTRQGSGVFVRTVPPVDPSARLEALETRMAALEEQVRRLTGEDPS